MSSGALTRIIPHRRVRLRPLPEHASAHHGAFPRCAQCKTAAGSRYLRTLLLQPSTDLDTISARLDCVSELLARDELLVDAHKVMASDEL